MNGVRCLVSFWQWTEAEQKAYLRDRIKGIIFDRFGKKTLFSYGWKIESRIKISKAIILRRHPAGFCWNDKRKKLETMSNICSAPTIPRGSQEAKAVVMSTPKLEGPLQSRISDETRIAFLHHFFNFRNGIVSWWFFKGTYFPFEDKFEFYEFRIWFWKSCSNPLL